MAAPGGKYFIQEKLKTAAPHHASFKALWETKWKPLCDMGVYPFMFGCTKDFQPVADDIIKRGLKEPYDWDEYAQCFFPKAAELVASAQAAEEEGEKEKASELYLRASALYRIARFPAPRSEKQRDAWSKGKEAAVKGLGLQEHPVVEVKMPHVRHAQKGDGNTLPAFYHLPAGASASNKVPLIIIFTGLDGYRTELVVWKEGWRQVGCALLVVEIPGTGDNPGVASDVRSADRVWRSMFDWIAQQDPIDQARLVNWGFSTGAYNSIRLAHTHADRLRGVAALGGGVHHMFDAEWLDHADHLEYPFDLAHTLCHKFGYGADFEKFKEEASDKFSLLKDGTLHRPCANLLLVNGTEDEIFPIDDYYLCLQHGGPKLARQAVPRPGFVNNNKLTQTSVTSFVPKLKHMGEPESFFIILRWIGSLLGIEIDIRSFMSTIPFKPKY